MSSLALEITEEFRRSGDPQARKNALTALGTLASSESVTPLVETALSDPDDTVRRRAELELAALQGEAAAHAAARIASALDSRHTERQAYAILARLSHKGWDAARPSGSPIQRLRRAFQLVYATQVPFLEQLRTATVGAVSIVGFSLPLILLIIAATGLRLAPDGLVRSVFLGAVLAWFVTLMTLWRTIPLREHADTRAAVAVDLLQTLVAGSIVAAMILGFAYANYAGVQDEVKSSWTRVAITGITTLIITRLGGFLAAGALPGYWNRLATTVVGATMGWIAVITGLLWSGALEAGPARLAPNYYFMPMVLAVAGVAFATAHLNATPPGAPPFPRFMGVVATALAAIGIPVVSAWLMIRHPATEAFEPAAEQVIDSKKSFVRLTVRTNPFRARFSTESTLLLDLFILNPGYRDLEIVLIDTASGSVIESEDDFFPRRMSVRLDAGEYLAVVGIPGTLAAAQLGPVGRRPLPVEFVLPVLANGLQALAGSETRPYDVTFRFSEPAEATEDPRGFLFPMRN